MGTVASTFSAKSWMRTCAFCWLFILGSSSFSWTSFLKVRLCLTLILGASLGLAFFLSTCSSTYTLSSISFSLFCFELCIFIILDTMACWVDGPCFLAVWGRAGCLGAGFFSGRDWSSATDCWSDWCWMDEKDCFSDCAFKHQ